MTSDVFNCTAGVNLLLWKKKALTCHGITVFLFSFFFWKSDWTKDTQICLALVNYKTSSGRYMLVCPWWSTCNWPWIHFESHDSCDWLPWVGGRKLVVLFGVRESYEGRHRLLNIKCPGLAWLRPSVTKAENKNITAKLFSFFHCPDQRHWNEKLVNTSFW